MITGKNVQVLANTTGTGAQAHVDIQLGPGLEGTAQIEITSPGTTAVRVQGRISPDAPWIDFSPADITASALVTTINRCWSQMRLNIISNTGTVRAWIMA